jgi:hypothetical protein
MIYGRIQAYLVEHLLTINSLVCVGIKFNQKKIDGNAFNVVFFAGFWWNWKHLFQGILYADSEELDVRFLRYIIIIVDC